MLILSNIRVLFYVQVRVNYGIIYDLYVQVSVNYNIVYDLCVQVRVDYGIIFNVCVQVKVNYGIIYDLWLQTETYCFAFVAISPLSLDRSSISFLLH